MLPAMGIWLLSQKGKEEANQDAQCRCRPLPQAEKPFALWHALVALNEKLWVNVLGLFLATDV